MAVVKVLTYVSLRGDRKYCSCCWGNELRAYQHLALHVQLKQKWLQPAAKWWIIVHSIHLAMFFCYKALTFRCYLMRVFVQCTSNLLVSSFGNWLRCQTAERFYGFWIQLRASVWFQLLVKFALLAVYSCYTVLNEHDNGSWSRK
jgi:hypothetical protein